MKKLVILALILGTTPVSLPAQSRIASDFEIAQMKAQLAASREFLAQLSGHMNLGDAYAARSELSTARARYTTALEIAARERVTSRRQSDLTSYSTATSYAAMAQAKLGRGPEAFALLEEAMRYSSDSAKSWNLYASAMNVLAQPRKAASAARNAVAIATREAAAAPSTANQLDLAIYQHALAIALIETNETTDAERLLRSVLASLESPAFDVLRRQVERSESFEVYSTARGEAAAYVSLLNRAQLRLAALLEARGDLPGARAAYQRVLETRTDDPTALTALARLSDDSDDKERDGLFAAAFDANPFSLPLIREYQRHLARSPPVDVDVTTTGGGVRGALMQNARGEKRAARATLDAMLRTFPGNETLSLLRSETESTASVPRFLTAQAPPARLPLQPVPSELRQLLEAGQRLAPEHRAALDALVFVSTVSFETADPANGQTVLLRGVIDDVPFRFSEPTAFNGVFTAETPLRLTYRILGPTEVDGRPALLLEPLGLAALP